MSTKPATRPEPGAPAAALDESLSDAEMDRLLAERHDEIEGLLEEARQARARGDSAPLEPLHVFLHRARERLKGRR